MLKDPAHPGELIREEVIPAFGLTVQAAADILRLTRANLTRVLNGQAALSPELALKIEKAFGVSAELLITMQARHDLARVRRDSADALAGIERQSVVEPKP